jgi:hypothetical protein
VEYVNIFPIVFKSCFPMDVVLSALMDTLWTIKMSVWPAQKTVKFAFLIGFV